MVPSAATCAVVEQVMGRLDGAAIGELYCDEGGAAFWPDRRDAALEVGLAWASELGRRLRPGGASLYAGAGVAELPVLLTEVLDLDRTCVAANLRCRECEVIARALADLDLAGRLTFAKGDVAEHCQRSRYDHLCAVSVLDDPETNPQLSAVTYGTASPLELDPSAFARERDAVRALVRRLLDALALPAWVSTTTDEAPWLVERCTQLGWSRGAVELELDTALVGDELVLLHLASPT
jgi:hypothetical protein